MAHKSFAVIGLGQFGRSVVKELVDNGMDVIALDNNEEIAKEVLRELGVKNIIVRVDDDYYIPIMKKLGATEVISPQKTAGTALANRIGNEDFQDYYKLDNKYSVVSIIINPGFFPVTLKDMNPKNVYGVNVVLVRRGSKSFVPGGNDSLLPDDTVYVVGTSKEISAFREAINGNKQKKK